MDVVLVARSEDKLETLADSLASEFDVKATPVPQPSREVLCYPRRVKLGIVGVHALQMRLF